jgi:thiosulfate dehydrogenase [quinone] large subunit
MMDGWVQRPAWRRKLSLMTTMTRMKSSLLTLIAATLYVFLGVTFADGLFNLDTFWQRDEIFSSSWVSYLLLALILGAGAAQASRLPARGVTLDTAPAPGPGQINDPHGWRLLLGNTYLAVLWLPLRFFVGQEWLAAGEHKVRDDAWMSGGTALQGFWERAVAVPEAPARPAISYAWFRDFLQYMLDHESYIWFAKVVAVGEVLVGAGLIFGALVGIAAFFGTVLNFNFMLAGTVSSNPVLFALAVFLVLGWKVAGWIGIDRFLLPVLGTPWTPGKGMVRLHRARPDKTPLPRPI